MYQDEHCSCFFMKTCCGYLLEVSREVPLMSIHDLWFMKKLENCQNILVKKSALSGAMHLTNFFMFIYLFIYFFGMRFHVYSNIYSE